MTTGWLVPITFRGDGPALPLPGAMRTALGLHPNKSVYITDNANGTYTISQTAPNTVVKLSHSGS